MSAKGGSSLKIDEVARLVTEEAKKDGRVDGVFGFNTAKRPPLSSAPSKEKVRWSKCVSWNTLYASVIFCSGILLFLKLIFSALCQRMRCHYTRLMLKYAN